MSAIVMEGVTKSFGTKTAVNDFSLNVEQGGLYGFIGPNGAGKTTCIRMVMSIIFPNAGRLSVLGKASAVESKDQIGYLPEERGVYRKMKVGAFLEYMGRLKGLDGGGSLNRQIEDWLERVKLPDVRKKKCEELSKGMQQKVQFIACVLHEPDLLILDEPFSGLDPVNMRLMRDLFIEQHNRGATIVFSTHVMHQAEQLCDHIVMIHDGEKVLDDTFANIKQSNIGDTIAFEPLDEHAGPDAVRAIDDILAVEKGSRDDKIEGWHALVKEGVDPRELLPVIAAATPLSRVEVVRPTLEDIFVGIAGVDPNTISSTESEEAELAGAGSHSS